MQVNLVTGKRRLPSGGHPSKLCATLARRGDCAMDVKLPPPLIVLPKQELTALMPFGEYVDAVADAFRLHAEGRSVSPPPMHIPADGGGFHVKAGSLPIGPGYTAIKVNANFPHNRATRGLPTIQ